MGAVAEARILRRVNKLGRFNKQDIQELCPTLRNSSIEGALRKMVSEKEIQREESSKNPCHFRLR